MISLLFQWIGLSQALQISLNPDKIGQFSLYQLNGISTSILYNEIKLIFPTFFTLEISATYRCAYNLASCVAKTSTNNIIVITEFQVTSENYELTIEGVENGQFAGSYQLIEEFFQDQTKIEEQLEQFSLSIGSQVLITCNYDSKFSFTQTSMTFIIQTQFKVLSGTVLELEFPILNRGAIHEQVMILENSIFKYNDEALQYQQNGYSYQLFNLFQQDYQANQELIIIVSDVYRKNIPIQQIIIDFKTYYGGKIVGTSFLADNQHPILSESKICDIQSSTSLPLVSNLLSFSIEPRLGYPENSEIIITFTNLQQSQQIVNANFVPKQNINPQYSFLVVSQGFIISQFNSIYDQILFQFEISDIINPIGESSFDITVVIQTNQQAQIEESLRSIPLLPNNVSNFEVIVSNSTVFASAFITLNIVLQSQQTKDTVIHLGVPSQIEIEYDSLEILPKQHEIISIVNGDVEISQYFYLHQNIDHFSITFMGKLAPFVCDSDSFVFFTFEPTTLSQISRLYDRKYISITQSSFTLNQFSPESKITDYLTTYKLIFQIPEVQYQSTVQLTLPEYYSYQTCLCQASIENDPSQCEIFSQGNVIVNLNKGGQLQILLYQIQTERSVQSYQYHIDGGIYKNDIEQSKLINGDFIVTLLSPQTFYHYSLTISNLFYGSEAKYTFSFELHSTILSTDVLELQLPRSINGIDSCDSNAKIIGDYDIELYVTNGVNNINCHFFNPLADNPIYPFEFNLKTNDGYLIAAFKDQLGIRDQLVSNSLDFSLAQSSFLLNQETNFSIIYISAFGVAKYGKITLLINSDLFAVHNLLCLGTNGNISQFQQFSGCQQVSIPTAFTITLTATSSIKPGSNILRYDGISLISNSIGTKTIEFTFLNINQFGAIIESKTITQTIQINCNDHCLECSQFYNNCTKCEPGFFQINFTCQRNCPQGMHLTDDQLCQVCMTHPLCLHCNINNVTECIQCTEGYNLINGYCVAIQSQIITESAQNTTNSNFTKLSAKKSSSANVQTQISALYDGIPIIVIIMLFLFVIILIKKAFYKQTLIIKSFYVSLSLLDTPVSILRLVRFVMLSQTGYFFLSLSTFGITLLIQVLSSLYLLLIIKTNFIFSRLVNNQFLKLQVMIIFQWRVVVSFITLNSSTSLLKDIKQLFKISLISQLASILILISFMLWKQEFYLFALDDSIFNLTLLILSLTKNKWIYQTNSIVCPLDCPQQILEINQ